MEFELQRLDIELKKIETDLNTLEELKIRYKDLCENEFIALIDLIKSKQKILNKQFDQLYNEYLEYADFISGIDL